MLQAAHSDLSVARPVNKKAAGSRATKICIGTKSLVEHLVLAATKTNAALTNASLDKLHSVVTGWEELADTASPSCLSGFRLVEEMAQSALPCLPLYRPRTGERTKDMSVLSRVRHACRDILEFSTTALLRVVMIPSGPGVIQHTVSGHGNSEPTVEFSPNKYCNSP